MPDWSWLPIAILTANVLVVVTVGIRVVMHRHPVGVSLAWLTLLFVLPFGGAALYLLIGEKRFGSRRRQRAESVLALYRGWQRELRERAGISAESLRDAARPLHRQIERTVGMPAMPGHALELVVDPLEMLRRLSEDIDGATETVHLEFYIWHPGGAADDVVAAVVRAARRGVRCRILVDAVGSRPFLESPHCRHLREAGVEVQAALPVGILRALFRRLDLRNHRKLALIDGVIAYTGSQNLVDPRIFKVKAGVGQWIDATVRLRGPAVEALAGTFLALWELETGQGLRNLAETSGVKPGPLVGNSPVQVLPSGPGYTPEALHQALLTAIYSARSELIVTTPYFVPDEAMLTALVSAAQRGVEVTLVLPEKVDSFFVRHASRAHFLDLLDVGVRVEQFRGGLLHAKTITIDGSICLIGSVNLDMRSLWINLELTLLVYDPDFAQTVRSLQFEYMEQSVTVLPDEWRARPARRRLLENAVQLLSPLL